MSTVQFLRQELESANRVLDIAEKREAELEAINSELLAALRSAVAWHDSTRSARTFAPWADKAIVAIAKATQS